MTKLVIVGPPRSGKSTKAREMRDKKVPTFCADPKSLVKEPEENVTYLPEGLSWSDASRFIVDEWFSKEGPWCIEGVATVRALRKALREGPASVLDGVNVLKITGQCAEAVTLPGQATMAKGVETIWDEIKHELVNVSELSW